MQPGQSYLHSLAGTQHTYCFPFVFIFILFLNETHEIYLASYTSMRPTLVSIPLSVSVSLTHALSLARALSRVLSLSLSLLVARSTLVRFSCIADNSCAATRLDDAMPPRARVLLHFEGTVLLQTLSLLLQRLQASASILTPCTQRGSQSWRSGRVQSCTSLWRTFCGRGFQSLSALTNATTIGAKHT